MHTLTIGVFDSGFGGLTVLHDLLPLIPNANYIYLGDTARLPYGSKSRETIVRYALSSARFLLAQGADLLVIACNTATALALEDIRADLPIPVIGVIQPGAEASSEATGNKNAVILSEAKDPCISPVAPQTPPQNHVLVLATTATIQSHAYAQALNALGLQATEKACPLLVPLVEEGWVNHPVTAEVLRIYLSEALATAPQTSTLLLGCTHYPLIKPLIASTLQSLNHPLHIIDSAYATAQATAALIATQLPNLALAENPTRTFYATDSIEKFQRLGSNFLGQPLGEVHLIDLGG
jgi:glutamate racemase